MERSEVFEPAQSYLLGAGFSRAATKSRSFASLRMTILLNLKGQFLMNGEYPLRRFLAFKFLKVNINERGLYEA